MWRKLFPVMVVMLLAVAVVGNPSRVNPEARRYTVRLPAVDRIELEKFKPQERVRAILATKVLEGEEAKAVAALWRTQNYRSLAAICHYPAYGIKFYSRSKLLAYASLCWECNNIVFITPKLELKQAFAGDSQKGKELLDVFARAFLN